MACASQESAGGTPGSADGRQHLEQLEQPVLVPRIEPDCVVCGDAGDRRAVTSVDEMEAQRRFLRLFHRRRLRAVDPEALEERATFTQDYATNVVECSRCGHVFRDPRPSKDAIARAYAADTYGEEKLPLLFDSQLELYRPKVRLLANWIATPDPVVLEIGSFVGGFLAASRERGWDAIGIDPGAEVAAFCEARGLRVLRESVETCSFPSGSADCVAIWNTFDQLADPHPTLRSARSVLRAGGVLAVRVPNGRCYARSIERLRRWPAFARPWLLAAMAWNNLVAFPYLQGYSIASLDRLMSAHGFRRVHASGDVLTRLADEQTKPWARREERVLKAIWRVAFSVATRIRADGVDEAPWMDVLYRTD